MAVNRIRGAFAVPKKGETYELRAGLVLVVFQINYEQTELIGSVNIDLNMHMKG